MDPFATVDAAGLNDGYRMEFHYYALLAASLFSLASCIAIALYQAITGESL